MSSQCLGNMMATTGNITGDLSQYIYMYRERLTQSQMRDKKDR